MLATRIGKIVGKIVVVLMAISLLFNAGVWTLMLVSRQLGSSSWVESLPILTLIGMLTGFTYLVFSKTIEVLRDW